MAKVERKGTTRSEHVRELIEEGIATGRFPPGMRLDEVELAERFNVSRTPLREALFQLASAGIVEMQPRRGTVVAEVSPHRMVEMFEVMAELEALCGRLAARRMLAPEHERLLATHRACENALDANDPDAYYYENERFHHAIYEGSHNGFLAQQVPECVSHRCFDRCRTGDQTRYQVIRAMSLEEGCRLRKNVTVQFLTESKDRRLADVGHPIGRAIFGNALD
jgi:DNA-binding GntR family transcriptional regulator